MRKINSRTLLKLLALLASVVVIILVVIVRLPKSAPPSQIDPRSLWQTHAISSYQIRLVTLALPVIPIALDLTIQNGEVINSSFVSCDNPTEQYPQRYCETIHSYYNYLAKAYTIDQLFAIAEDCIHKTKTVLEICPAVDTANFSGFSNLEEMMKTAELCQDYLQSLSELCSVEYNADYGYPQNITYYMPGVDDGISLITVESFQVSQ